MLSFIKFRMPALHDNFFESLWMWDFQLRFSSRVTQCDIKIQGYLVYL